MVTSSAATVDEYLAALPDDRRPVMAAIRDVCRAELAGFTEAMAYGMPCYLRGGEAEVAIASQKRHIAFYLMRTDVKDAFTARLAAHDMGKGCLRFSTPAKVDLDLVRDLARATAAAPGPVCD
ncbi:iron chaperone [Glycomyces sp. MUSA5-2]|uniref:iron chaperone n=1 Tax=Glycomyces sp. MUSA5-2 TaxID=2053002 RepID=UPI003009384F